MSSCRVRRLLRRAKHTSHDHAHRRKLAFFLDLVTCRGNVRAIFPIEVLMMIIEAHFSIEPPLLIVFSTEKTWLYQSSHDQIPIIPVVELPFMQPFPVAIPPRSSEFGTYRRRFTRPN